MESVVHDAFLGSPEVLRSLFKKLKATINDSDTSPPALAAVTQGCRLLTPGDIPFFSLMEPRVAWPLGKLSSQTAGPPAREEGKIQTCL